jgi:hypothetical protein
MPYSLSPSLFQYPDKVMTTEKKRKSSLFNTLNSSYRGTSSLLGSNIFVSILFSKTWDLTFPPKAEDLIIFKNSECGR